MINTINPILSTAIREGKIADVIHAIAQDMMGRRSHLLQDSIKVPKGEARVYRKQSRLLGEYAAVLDAIYYQLEPAKWDPEKAEDLLRLAQAHHITLPEWMSADEIKPVKMRSEEIVKDTAEDVIGRFDNEGGQIWENL